MYALYKYAHLCTCIRVHTYMSICTHNICRYRYIYILGIVYLFSGKKDMERSKTTSPATSISLHLIGHKQVTWPPLVRKKNLENQLFSSGLLSLAGTSHDSFMLQTK